MLSGKRATMRWAMPLTLAGVCFAVTWASLAGDGRAQQRLDARSVAGAVQSYYDQVRDLQADFVQTHFQKLYNRYDRARGSVFFKKPGKMRWNYASPNGKVVVSDGTRLLYFEPGERGQPGQVIEQPMRNAELPSALSFLTGTGRLGEQFTFRLLDARREGFPGGYVLELTPRVPTPQYERVLLFVSAQPLGTVQRVLILDAAGNRNKFEFSNMRFNRTVADTTFQWTPPAGTRRVQP